MFRLFLVSASVLSFSVANAEVVSDTPRLQCDPVRAAAGVLYNYYSRNDDKAFLESKFIPKLDDGGMVKRYTARYTAVLKSGAIVVGQVETEANGCQPRIVDHETVIHVDKILFGK